jgi:hypothetical protein
MIYLIRSIIFIFAMKFQQVFIGLALLSSGTSVVQLPNPAHAATFNFITGTNSNSATKQYIDSGITLTASNSNSTGTNPNTLNGPNTGSFEGLCVWTKIAGGLSRCGYGTVNGSGISRFQLTFDQAVSISSFNINAVDGVSSGSLGFSIDNIVFNTTSFKGSGNQTLASLFNVGANQPIFVRTSATTLGSTGGVIRLGSLTTVMATAPLSPAPAPLPILGVAVGFRLSRGIRKQIGLASRHG